MGKIKKILENELVGGTQSTDVYPITSIKAVYDENNERLDGIISELQKSADSSLETENKTIVGSINELKRLQDEGYLFKDVATPTTDPGIPKAKVFYIANGKGTYEKFGGINVTEDEVVVLYWDTAWHKEVTGIASNEKLTELKEKVDALALGTFYGYFPDSSSLPVDVTTPGYAYVGLDNPYKIWNFNGESWSDSGTSIDMNDADEEDITRNADGKLQFKDRAYGDGMGYVILRKGRTFAEQVTATNTIYEIRYDFNLDGDEVRVPANCVLKFNGGKVANGTLIGDNTTILAQEVKIFDGMSFRGSWVGTCGSLLWFGAKGDGVTDDTSPMQSAIDFAFATRISIHIPKGNFVISSTILVQDPNVLVQWASAEGIRVFGENSELTKFLAKIDDDSDVFYFKNVNNGASSTGIIFKGFSIIPYNVSCGYKFIGLHLENSMGNTYEDISIKRALTGAWLTTTNDGYCEFNNFTKCSFSTCVNGIFFQALFPGLFTASFHGNKFFNCSVSIGGSVASDTEIGYDVPKGDFCAINFEGGILYNCVFDINSFIARNAVLMRCNCTSRENQGTIRYEVTDSYAKIKTGNYAASFNMHGVIYGYGKLDWSEASPIAVGDVASYNNDGSVASYVEEGNASIGRRKIYIDGTLQTTQLDSLSVYGNPLVAESLVRNIGEIYETPLHELIRYRNSSGSSEEGFVFVATNNDLPNRVIFANANRSNADLSKLIKGFVFEMSGRNIISYYQNQNDPISIKFGANKKISLNGSLSVYNNLLVGGVDVMSKFNFPGSLNTNGYTYLTNGLRLIWGSRKVVGAGTDYLTLSDYGNIIILSAQITPVSSSKDVINTAWVQTIIKQTLLVNYNFAEDSSYYYLVLAKI